MKLHSPRFEKALKVGVKKRIRASRELKKEFRRSRTSRFYSGGTLGGYLLAPIVGLEAYNAIKNISQAAGLAVITCVAFGTALFYAHAFWKKMARDKNLVAFVFLPIPDEEIFRWQWSRFVLQRFWAIPGYVFYYIPIGFGLGFTRWQWLGILPVALATWFVTFALGVILARIPIRLLTQLTAFVTMIGVAGLVTLEYSPGTMQEILRTGAPLLNLLLPTGWGVSLFELLLPDGQLVMAAFLLPLILLLAIPFRNSVQAFRKIFIYREYVSPVAHDIPPEPVDASVPANPLVPAESPAHTESPDRPLRVGVTEIEEIVRKRLFLSTDQPQQKGWMEALFWKWLTPRQKALAGFAFPAGISFLRPWLAILRATGLYIGGGIVCWFLLPHSRPLVVGFMAFMPTVYALAKIDDSGRAFESMAFGGTIIPRYATLGIGFHELARLLLKYTAMQFLIILPLFVGMAIPAFAFYGITWQPAPLFAAKCAVLFFASRFFFMMFSFSRATNDTAKGFRTVFILTVIVALGLLFLAVAIAALFSPKTGYSALFCAIALFIGWLTLATYGLFYNRGWFDLIKINRS